jgi:cell division protein FtsN
MKKSRSLARRLETGGTILGFMAGLIFGLSIAVFVAIFVTRAPVPFVNKIGKSSDRVTEPKSAADAPDPNKPLYSKNRPGGGAGSSEAPTQPSVLGGILNNPENKPAPKPASPAPLPPVAVAPATAPTAPASPVTTAPPAEAKPTDPPKDDKTNYTLQAGAFKLQEDADSMKARLALIGFEARILTAEVNGQALYRVRVGPYVGLEDMNKVRVKLAESGIEASVIRQR